MLGWEAKCYILLWAWGLLSLSLTNDVRARSGLQGYFGNPVSQRQIAEGWLVAGGMWALEEESDLET